MVKIMFVCHGNICRSPLAEFLMKDKLEKQGLEGKAEIKSSGTSYEEIGNPVYPPIMRILNGLNINCSNKRSEKLLEKDYGNYDFFICMDERNVKNTLKIFNGDKENKVYKLLDFVGGGDVADPYYYGGYDKTFSDVDIGTDAFIKFLKDNNYL